MRSEDIFSLYPETIVLGTSLSCTVSALPGQLACTLKYGSGGTLYFLGTSSSIGCSFATAQKYPIGLTEVFSFDSAGQFRVGAEGATTTFYLVRGRSMGFDQT